MDSFVNNKQRVDKLDQLLEKAETPTMMLHFWGENPDNLTKRITPRQIVDIVSCFIIESCVTNADNDTLHEEKNTHIFNRESMEDALYPYFSFQTEKVFDAHIDEALRTIQRRGWGVWQSSSFGTQQFIIISAAEDDMNEIFNLARSRYIHIRTQIICVPHTITITYNNSDRITYINWTELWQAIKQRMNFWKSIPRWIWMFIIIVSTVGGAVATVVEYHEPIITWINDVLPQECKTCTEKEIGKNNNK